MRTLKTLACLSIIVSLFGIVQTANAAVSFDINVSRGPVNSTSFGLYVDNAGRYTFGSSLFGDETQPYWFALLGNTVEATDFIVSSNNNHSSGGFTSWTGQANPTGSFSQEVGNRLYFASTWITSATPISLDKLTFSITSGPNNILGLDKDGNPFVVTYSGYPSGGMVQGRNWGPDGTPGTGDDSIPVGTEASFPANDIVISLGIGNGVNAVNAPGTTNQDKLDNTVEAILLGGPSGSGVIGLEGGIETITFTVSYDWGGGNIESSSKILTVVPEPASLALFGIGTVLVATRRRHIQK